MIQRGNSRYSGEPEKVEYEKCILCGKETNVRVDEHIHNRFFYVEGAGQMCSKCWSKTYDK
jgi:hypothetical protein